jgi:hypothetical protein
VAHPIVGPDVLDEAARWPHGPARVIRAILAADVVIVVLGLWYVALALAALQVVLVGFGIPWAKLPDDLRVVHGLEHATIAILLARGIEVLHGRAEAAWFHIAAARGDRTERELEATVRASAEEAIRRILRGEHALAYHRDCGARLMLAKVWGPLTAGAIALIASLWLAPWLAIALAVAFAVLARLLAGRLAFALQRWRTVSTDFAHAAVSTVRIAVDATLFHAVVVLRGSRA